MRFAFVTDGGEKMGMGHVMRSITLASEIAHSKDAFFITSSDNAVQELIQSKGFKVEFSEDNQKIVETISRNQADAVIIDRVTVDEEVTKSIKESLGLRIIVMDSETKANRWADVVVNGLLTSKFVNEHFFDETTETLYYCGPKYLILKSDFSRYSKDSVAKPEEARKVLLIYGGSDPMNITDKTLRGLLELNNRRYEIDIIMGPKFVYREEIVSTLDEYGIRESVTLFQNTEKVAEVMCRNDLIFTSPGLSMFEGLSVGCNVIVSPQNKLQRTVYDYFFKNYSRVPEIYRFFDESFILIQTERKVQEMEIGSGRAEVIKAIIGS